MSNGTSVTIVGNLTKDPEERATMNGGAITSFSVASSRRWKNKNDEWEEETSYFDVTAWAELGKNAAKSLKKGNRVVVVGRLKQESWSDKNGDKRNKIVVIAEDIGASVRLASIPQIVKNESNGNYARSESPKQPVWDDQEEPF